MEGKFVSVVVTIRRSFEYLYFIYPGKIPHQKSENLINMKYHEFFFEWKCWDRFEPRIDGINGVYAFRLKSDFPRLKGASKVLYIGMCQQNSEKNSRPGIWHRLQNYRQNNYGASQRLKKIEEEFGGKSGIEYSYVVCEKPRDVEISLLDDYLTQHLELPPLNRSK